MIYRKLWVEKLFEAWKLRPLIWLSGVRRSGKTSLAKMLPEAKYYNCDLPSVVRMLEDPEYFYQNHLPGSILIFDEIHRLKDPSLVLKIGVDEHPDLKILATGSSTLSATSKFRDSLTGRKINLYLPPVIWKETVTEFGIPELDKRLMMGGLPEFLLSDSKNISLYSEWIDSYYARDIQELFQVRNREGFLKLLKLLFIQSSGFLEISKLAKDSGLSRPTVMSHIESLSVAHAIYLVTPFSDRSSNEIVKRPKAYAFDTGFVTHVNGWNEIRETDRGLLWEHLVLDMLRVYFADVHYWRDKDDAEVDFVVKGKGKEVHVFECKINPDKFSAKSVMKFRRSYPEGRNFCICPHLSVPYSLLVGGIPIEFVSDVPSID